MKVKLFWLGIAIVLLLIASGVSAADACPADECQQITYTDPVITPQPVFNVSYYSTDVNVFIDKYNLSRNNGIEYVAELTEVLSGKEYHFRVTDYLINGDYSLVVYATDADDNTRRDTFLFTVNIEEMDIWISTPRIPKIPLREQFIGVGIDLPFDIVVNTELDSTCRVKNSLPSDASRSRSELYIAANEITATPTKTHVFKAVAPADEGVVDGILHLAVPRFNSNQYALTNSFTIICEIPSVDGSPADYGIQEVYLGYDNTPPTYIANFDPDPIDDRASLLNELTLTSYDDFVFCEHYPTIGDSPLPADYAEILLEADEGSLMPFSKEFIREFNFASKSGQIKDKTSYVYAFNFVCTNLAGLTNVNTSGFTINVENNLDITLDHDTFAEARPTLPLRTNLNAFCSYTSINGDTELFGSITEDDATRIHSFLLPESIGDGEHTTTIFCASEGGIGQAEETFDFTISSVVPLPPELNMSAATCGEDPRVSIHDPSPDALPGTSFVVALYEGAGTSGNPIDSGTTQSDSYTTSTQLVNGQTYTFSVYTVSPSGLESTPTTASFVHSSDVLLCDDANPQLTMNVLPVGNGFEVSVACTDNAGNFNSGCDVANGWSYQLVDRDSACPAPSALTQSQSYTLPLLVDTDGKICVAISDRSGRTVTDEDEITIFMDIDLESPLPFGIASVTPFSFRVAPQRPAICKFGPTPPTTEYNRLAAYNNMRFFNTSDGTPATTPDITFTTELNSTDTLFSGSSLASVTVLCNENGIISKEDFTIGYDETPPVITGITPSINPVQNPADLTTTITVTTNEPTICTFLSTDNVNDLQELRNNEPFGINDPENEDSYATTHEAVLDYTAYFTGVVDQQNITCIDKVGLITTQGAVITVDPEQGVGITLLSEDTWGSTPVTFSVRTNAAAVCEVRIADGEVQPLTESENDLVHTISGVALDPGTHRFEVSCINIITTIPGGRTFSITYDNGPPSLELSLNQFTCDLDTIKGWANVSDSVSGIQRIAYNLTNASGFAQDGTINPNSNGIFSIDANTDLSDGSTYTLTVTAIDKSGLRTTRQGSITASISNVAACDTTPPSAKIVETLSDSGFDVRVECTDVGSYASGCQEVYSYTLATGDVCPGTYTNTNTLLTTTVPVEQDTLFCAQVADKVPLYGTAHKRIGGAFSVALVEPTFGLAGTKEFALKINTSRAATCRHGPALSPGPDSEEELFGLLDPFAITGSTEHQTVISAAAYNPQLDASAQTSVANWVVVCLEGDGFYRSQEIGEIGFDVREPIFSVTSRPNPVIDPAIMQTTISVQAQMDVICTYLDKPNNKGVRKPLPFPGYDITNENAYKRSHEIIVTYWEKDDIDVDEQRISCRSKASLAKEETLTVNINLQERIRITSTNAEYTRQNTYPFVIQTAPSSTCEYTINDPETAVTSFTSQDNTAHTAQLSLTQGTHHIYVTCVGGNQVQDRETFVQVVDSVPPTLDIVTGSESCSLSELTGVFRADGTGSPIQQITYTLSEGVIVLVESTTTELDFSIPTTLVGGSTYTLSATATDAAGNNYTTTKTITGSSSADASCVDKTKGPSGLVRTQKTLYGTDVTVSCVDTDCTESYSYYFSDTPACEDEHQYMSSTYAQGALFVGNTKTLCYRVYDVVGNIFDGQELIQVDAHCFNDIIDGDEEGFNCGGSCGASCDQCANGKKDAFEEGVDCGGSCQSSCAFTNEDTCSTNADCSFQEMCGRDSLCVLDADGDNLPDTWELKYFTDLIQTGSQDYDGDSSSNREEYLSGSDPTQTSVAKETGGCSNDFDCGLGERCVSGICQQSAAPPSTNSSSSNTIAIILIIVGILLIGGGSGYIYYSRTTKQEQQSFAQARQYREQQAALAKAQEEQRKKQLAAIHKRQEEQQQKRSENVEKRHKDRSSVFDSFSSQTQTLQDEPEGELFSSILEEQKKLEEEESKKFLDDGNSEEYVDVRELGSDKNKEKRTFDASSPFSSLASLQEVVSESSVAKKETSKTKTRISKPTPLESAEQQHTEEEVEEDIVLETDVAVEDKSDTQTSNEAKKTTAQKDSPFDSLASLAQEMHVDGSDTKDLHSEIDTDTSKTDVETKQKPKDTASSKNDKEDTHEKESST